MSFQYHIGPWMGCSALCGKGERKRDVLCYGKSENGTLEVKDDSECVGVEKPESSEECDSGNPCDPSDWLVTPWSTCSPLDMICGN